MATQEELEAICQNAGLVDFGDDEAIICGACVGIQDKQEIFPERGACIANEFWEEKSEEHPPYHARYDIAKMHNCPYRNK